MEAHIEKPFQCTTCLARFTNEDHLQVHKKRHEMSLNLNGSKGLEDGFVDQTPTPTHLCRSLEDVGLFQDLQNINPFDAQFVKATPSEIHSDTAFQFNFSFPRNDSHPHAAATPTNNDTLNTPQIPGFSPTTPLPHNDKSPKKVLTPSQEMQDTLGSGSSAPPRPKERKLGPTSVLVPKPTIPLESPSTSTQVETPSTGISIGQTHLLTDASTDTSTPQRKTEMLERNRAAASRSRERRKQWVSSLELKCAALQTELGRMRTENRLLREELIRHVPTSYLVKPLFQPTILRSASSLTSSPIQMRSRGKRGRPRKGEELSVPTLPQTPSTPAPPPPKIQILPLSALRTTSVQPLHQHTQFLLLPPSNPS